jgi:hypothetical protein
MHTLRCQQLQADVLNDHRRQVNSADKQKKMDRDGFGGAAAMSMNAPGGSLAVLG